MRIEHEIQRLIFNALSGSSGLTSMLASGGIVDHRAQPVDGADTSVLPCVTIGDDSFVSSNTDSTIGVIGTIRISAFSAKKGMSELKLIAAEIRDALERIEPSSDYVNIVDMSIDRTDFISDLDLRISRAVIEVRIIADSVE